MNLIRRCPASLFLVSLVSPLACASSGGAQDTARGLLDRAAYAEEHERDLAAAAELYERAAATARDAGDSATEQAAVAARARVLARQGKAAPQSNAAYPTPQLARLLAAGSRSDPESEAGAALIKDIAVAGASAVRWLETMFSSETPFALSRDGMALVIGMNMNDGWMQPNPKFAVHALALIDAPEAAAAVERCYASPDPLVRIEVAAAASPRRHPALLERMLDDPVLTIAERAAGKLNVNRDPKLAAAMERVARAGGNSALSWLCEIAPERALLLLEDRALPIDLRSEALQELSRRRSLPPTIDVARRVLALRGQFGGSRGGDLALGLVFELLQGQQWQTAMTELREPLGALFIAELERGTNVELVHVLARVGPDALPEALLALLRRVGSPPPAEVLEAVRQAVRNSPAVPSPAAFANWVEFLRELPRLGIVERDSPQLSDWVVERLASLSQSTPYEALIASVQRVPDALRDDYWRVLDRRVQSELGRGGHTASDGSFAPDAIDPQLIDLALASLELANGAEAGKRVVECLRRLGDVERLPLAFDLLCNRDIGGNAGAGSAIDVLIRRDPKRARELLEQRLAELPAKESQIAAGMKQLGYVATSSHGIVQDDPNAVVRVIGYFDDPIALELFRVWHPKLASAELRMGLHATLVRHIQGEEALEECIRRYPEFADPSTRAQAIERFAAELALDAVPLLGEALRDSNKSVRAAAQTASATFREQRQALEEFAAWSKATDAERESITELVALLASPNRDVVLGAVRSLGALRASTALPALVKLLERNDAELKKAVNEALARFGE